MLWFSQNPSRSKPCEFKKSRSRLVSFDFSVTVSILTDVARVPILECIGPIRGAFMEHGVS